MVFVKKNRRYSLFTFFYCSFLLFACIDKVEAQVGKVLDDALQEILDEARDEFGPVGTTMAIHIPDRGMWVGSSGFSEVQSETPLRPDHLFRVASITKTFVATTILLMSEDGVLNLGDSVEQWLPSLVPNGENVTIQQLLNHTSGLHDYTSENSFWESMTAEPNRVWGRDEVVNFATANGPDFDPGTRWSYSSTGFVVLGMIVEKATGNVLAEEIRTRVLEPLGLDSTFLPGDEEVRGELAHGYFSSGGQLVDTESSPYTALETSAWAAGAMISSAGDLARFADALFGGRVLEVESLEQMLRFDNAGFDVGYGLGIQASRTPMGISVGHGGTFTGFRSFMDYIADHKITIAVLVNQEIDASLIRNFTLRRIMQMGELFPAESIQMLGDDVASGWSITSAEGAESAELTTLGPVYEGDIAASIQVAKPARFSARWKVVFTPETPLLPLGYTAVRLAVHPGNLEAAATSNFSIALNGARSSENLLRGTKEGLMVDVARKEWQIIEVPIEFFQLLGPIEHIDIQGNMGGTFYVDDVKLVAAPHPPATAVLENRVSSLPQDLALSQNYPNPFNSGTVIRFALPQRDDVQLAVYNMAGQKVANLVEGVREAGSYAIRWDGRDDAGRGLASGIYFYRLQAGRTVQETSRKLLLLR